MIQDLTRIMPFINNQHSANQQTITTDNTATSTKPPIAFPAFILRAAGGYTPIDEIAFFERFCSHVESQGFRYRRADLISFHLNFRTSEFFILGGLSGTGKSSLPRLYMEALVGDQTNEIQRLHRVAVNPTWMDVNDVLGRVNLLDRTYNPSESGIYRHLIFAEQEYRNLALESGFWPLVLDEMNLAQVEHYFGAFMQKFGASDDRGLRIFDEAVIRSEDPFAPWSLLSLPPSLRFIGTVNFDETTRPLSQRLLDRGALMLIDVAPRTATSGTPRQAAGPAVCLRNLQDWSSIKQAAPPKGAKLLGDIDPLLRGLGCPFNPRRREAVTLFLQSATPGIATPDEAFDMVLSQRVLSLVRGLFRPSARETFERLSDVIAQAGFLPESERVLADIREREDVLLVN